MTLIGSQSHGKMRTESLLVRAVVFLVKPVASALIPPLLPPPYMMSSGHQDLLIAGQNRRYVSPSVVRPPRVPRTPGFFMVSHRLHYSLACMKDYLLMYLLPRPYEGSAPLMKYSVPGREEPLRSPCESRTSGTPCSSSEWYGRAPPFVRKPRSGCCKA